VLLGVIIEKVSGLSYYDYVQRNIFEAAGMKDTGSLPESVDVPNRSVGYMWKDSHWVSNTDTLPYRGTAAGGGYSTLGDLLNFAQALQDGRLLSTTLLTEATTPHNYAKSYGYGFGIMPEGPAQYYGHNGGAPGMSADFRIYPDAWHGECCTEQS
jgi:D-alanyl-D-alanine carboxypeptidase